MKLSRIACLTALLLMPLMGIAQEIDLWDTWRLGFEKYEAAEKEFKKKNLNAALKLYKESQTIFQKIKRSSPDWNTDVVTYRISLCDRKIKSINVPAAPNVAEKQLSAEVAKLKKEVQNLNAQLRQTRVQLIDARNAADRMALTEKQIRKLMSENSNLQKKLAAKDAAITSLRADLRRSDKTAEFQKLLLDAKTDLERLRLLNNRLKKDLEIAKARTQKFMEQRNAAEKKAFRLDSLTQDLSAKTKEAEVLSGENRKLAAALNQITEKLKLTEQSVAVVKRENTNLLNKIGDMESGKILSSSEKKLRDDLTAERQAVVSLKASVEKFKLESQNLSTELAKIRGENQKVVLDLVKATELLAKLRNENSSQAKVIASQKIELDTAAKLASENTDLKKNIAEISKNFENFRQQASKDTADKVKDLTVALENARAEYRFMAERLRRADENLKNSIAKLQQTIVKLEEEKAVLRQSLILANQDVGSSKSALEKLKLEYFTLKKEFDALNVPAVNKEHEAKLEKLNRELVQLRKENAENSAKLAEKSVVNKEYEAKLEKLNKEHVQLRKENAENSAKLAEKSVVNKEYEAKLEKLNRELVQLRKENAENSAKLAEKPVVNKELESKLEKLTQELAKLRKENAENSAKLAEKPVVNKELESELEKLTQELAQLRKENTDYRVQLAAKKAVVPVSAANKELESKLEKLTQELTQLRKENSDYRVQLAAKSAGKQVDPAAAVNKELEIKLGKLSREVAQLKKENADYRVQLAAKPAESEIAAKKELESKLGKLSQEVAHLRKENSDYRAQLSDKDSVVAANKDLEAKLEKLSQDLVLLKKDNANYRIQLAAFNNLQKELDALRIKLTSANNEVAKKDSENVANKEQIRLLNQKVNEQTAAVKAAQDALAEKDAVISTNAKDMQKVVDLLKKQLLAAQTSETALRKELELLKMEYSDLEKKTVDSVPKNTMITLRAQITRLDKELTTLRAAKAESDTALKSAEEIVKTQKQRLDEFAAQINPDAKNQINKLTASVIELQEAKIQYEALISKLRNQIKDLNEDNKELKLANTGFRADVAELKVKPIELQKVVSDLKSVNENLRNLNKEQTERVRQLREKTDANDKTIASLKQELNTSQSLVQRYRKELSDWGELPQANLTEDIAKKDKAIDSLITENTSLKNERDMLKTELILSKDFVVKYKKLSLDLDKNLQMNNIVMARLKNSLSRYIPAADVENLITEVYESKKGEFGNIAPVEEIQANVAKIKKEEEPQFTQNELKKREAEYNAAMKRGIRAEKEKDYTEALMQYWRASSLCSDAAEVNKALARVYLARRDFQNARNHYRIAVQEHKLKRDPEFEEKLVVLAQEIADATIARDARSGENQVSDTTGNKRFGSADKNSKKEDKKN